MDAARIFEWDEAKAASNEAKHGVNFQTAAAAFDDVAGVIEADTRRAYPEPRFRLFAAVEGFPLCIVFTMRAGATRIISAREANRKER